MKNLLSNRAFRALVGLVLCSAFTRQSDGKTTFTVSFNHKFSNEVQRRLSQIHGGRPYVLPLKHTTEYHKLLIDHDLHRHGRVLADGDPLTFAYGNLTYSLWGGLYYTTVDVGNPTLQFLVALDTGSDLFWLPCECLQCAPATSPTYEAYGINKPLNRYTPTNSNTSSALTCSSDYCSAEFSTCSAGKGPAQCSYLIQYVSANTSSSGPLYQDSIYLVPNDNSGGSYGVPVPIGCGQTQTGNFISDAAFDGIMGLGRSSYSVPNVMASTGLVEDSFSMCLGIDGNGRVVFGDVGSPNISTTPFVDSRASYHDSWYVSVDSIVVGNVSVNATEVMLFDTGTSFTYFPSDLYKEVINQVAEQITDYTRIVSGIAGPFELCYLASDPSKLNIPALKVVFGSGAAMLVQNDFVDLFYQNNNSFAGFCIGLLSSESPVIGANFMLGFNLIFDMANMQLGFEESDCYTEVSSGGLPSAPTSTPTSSPPSPTTSPGGAPPTQSPSPPLSPESPPTQSPSHPPTETPTRTPASRPASPPVSTVPHTSPISPIVEPLPPPSPPGTAGSPPPTPDTTPGGAAATAIPSATYISLVLALCAYIVLQLFSSSLVFL